jgi:hypothetical protein
MAPLNALTSRILKEEFLERERFSIWVVSCLTCPLLILSSILLGRYCSGKEFVFCCSRGWSSMPVGDEEERRGRKWKGGGDEREKRRGEEREWIRLIEGIGKDKHP